MLQSISSRSSISTNSTGTSNSTSSLRRRPQMPTLEKLAIVTPSSSPRQVKRLPARASWNHSYPHLPPPPPPQHPYPYPYHYPYPYPPYPYPPPPPAHRASAPPHPYYYPPPPQSRSRPCSPPQSEGVYSPEMASSFKADYKGRLYPRYGLIGGQGPYGLPCDEEEVERLDGVHWMLRTLLGAPFYGPLQSVMDEAPRGRGKRILDVGTGSGVWAIDVAEMFPHAEVVGVDMAPMQTSKVPDNCSFELADVNEGLPYPDASFNVIHARMLLGGLRDVTTFFRDVARVLRPDGVFLLFEPGPDPPALAGDAVPPESHALQAWHDALKRSRGPLHDAESIIDAFRASGLHDFQGGIVRAPIGPWSDQPHLKHVGILNLEAIKVEARAYEYLLQVKGGYTPAEITVLHRAFVADLEKHPLYSSFLAFHYLARPSRSSSRSPSRSRHAQLDSPSGP